MNRHLTEKELIEYRFRLASDEQAAASAEHVAGCAECRKRLEQLSRKFAALDLLREDVHASEELIAQVVEQAKGAPKAKVVPFYTLKWIGAVAAVLVVGFVVYMGGLTKEKPAGLAREKSERFAGGGPEKSELANSDSARRSQPLDEGLVESRGRSVALSDEKSDSRDRRMPTSNVPSETPVTLVGGTKVKVEEKAAGELVTEEGETTTYAFGIPKKGEVLGRIVGEPVEGSVETGKPVKVAAASAPSGGAGLPSLETTAMPEQPPFAPASAIELVTLPRRDSVQLTIYNASDSMPVRFGGSGMMGGFGSGRRFANIGQANQRPGGLIRVIQETIEPESWYDLSDTGEGTIQMHDKKLVVRQTPQIHRKIEKLLQAMRGISVTNNSSISIERRNANRAVYQQLDQIVDLSEMTPATAFCNAIETLRKSVDPPLKIVVLWKDLLEMAEIEEETPIRMDGPSDVRLEAGLKMFLQALSSEFAELHYVVKDGVIMIGTIGTLPENLETRVYDIADLDSGMDEPAIEQVNRRDITENRGSQRPPSIIPDSLTLVRERRNLTLKRGWNWLQFMWANTLIDPTSLSLEPLEQAGRIEIQQLVFPARLRELGRWLIRSEISGQVPFEITYFTSGLSWRAFYMGTLSQDEKSMHLSGYVRVGNNSGEDYENAQTRLVVGKVHLLDQIAELAQRQYPYDRPGLKFGRGFDLDAKGVVREAYITNGAWRYGGMGGYGGGMMGAMKPKEIVKEGLSEYFLYTIEGTETIPNEWGKRLLSFEADDIAVESLYKYDEERWGGEAIRFVKFANDEDHKLGQTPIPDGTVRIYGQADEQGLLSYVGGTDVKYIPVGEEVELNLGPARLVKVEPKLMDFKTDSYVFDTRGNISGWDEIRTWQIEMTNTRTLPVEIEITRGFGTAYWMLQSDTPYEKHDATHARFEVSLEPRSKQALDYTVTTCHGAREQTFTE